MPKVFVKGSRSKNVRIRTVKTVRNNKVSIGGMLMAALLLIIGFAAFSAGFTNVGSIFILLGVFVLVLALLPILGLPGWVVALIALGGLVVVIIGSLSFAENMFSELDAFVENLPEYIWDWLFPGD